MLGIKINVYNIDGGQRGQTIVTVLWRITLLNSNHKNVYTTVAKIVQFNYRKKYKWVGSLIIHFYTEWIYVMVFRYLVCSEGGGHIYIVLYVASIHKAVYGGMVYCHSRPSCILGLYCFQFCHIA